jgi:hypothetical protein
MFAEICEIGDLTLSDMLIEEAIAKRKRSSSK